MTQTTSKTTNVDTQFLVSLYRAIGAAYDYVNLHDVADAFRNQEKKHQSSPLASYFEGLRHELGDLLLVEEEDESSE